MSLDLEKVIKESNLPSDAIHNSRIDVQSLVNIYQDHCTRNSELELWADTFANRLRRADGVHSVKARVKNPEHLVGKIIRKKLANPERDYTLDNYSEQIDDLIGLRALHLFKTDWLTVHNYVLENWDVKPKEPIRAYVRKGDPEGVLESYAANGCQVEEHPRNYRSIHYILEQPLPKSRKLRFELQVRTLFEEGWGEVDHLFSYPNNTDDTLLCYMSGVLNRAAGIADEMSSFMAMLQGTLETTRRTIAERDTRLSAMEDELAKAIHQSQATSAEKQELESKLKALSRYEESDKMAKWINQLVSSRTSDKELRVRVNNMSSAFLLGQTMLAESNKRNSEIGPQKDNDVASQDNTQDTSSVNDEVES